MVDMFLSMKVLNLHEGVKLRPLQQSDDYALLKILDRDKSIRNRVTFASRLHSLKDFTAERELINKDTGLIRYTLLKNGIPIGLVSLWRDDGFWGVKNLDDYGFGYFLEVNERGKGLITLSVKKLMDVVASNLQVNQFVAFCEDENLASIALLKRMGFEPTEETQTEPSKGWIERKYIKTARNST